MNTLNKAIHRATQAAVWRETAAIREAARRIAVAAKKRR